MAADCSLVATTWLRCGDVWVHNVLSAEPLTMVITLAILVVRTRGVYFARGPLRRVKLRLTWALRSPARKGTTYLDRRRVFRLLTRALNQVQRGAPPSPVTVGRQLCPRVFHREIAAEWPFEQPRFVFAREVVRRTLEPRSSTLLARYLLTDRWSANRTFLTDLLAYLDQFAGLRPTLRPEVPKGAPLDVTLSFAEVVSVWSGALVLADGTTSNAARIDHLAVWHNGLRQQSDGRELRRRFSTAWDVAIAQQTTSAAQALPGQYNGRVPVLRRVEVRQHLGSDDTVLVLETDETDYDSTERASGIRCKKLTPAQHDSAMAMFRPADQVVHGVSSPLAGSWQTGGTRAPMLNGKVALVSMTAEGNFLVLVQRSGKVSNAPDVLAQSSGGVIELAVPGDARDADAFGAADFLGGIRRKLHEELGLTARQYELSANCVYAANTRPRPRDGRGANGELVTTVLTVARTPLSRTELRNSLFRASPNRYKSTGVVFVPMGGNVEAFADAVWHGAYRREPVGWTRTLATRESPALGESRILDELEQSGLIAALYASATVFGPGPTICAFRAKMPDKPWWMEPWPPDDPEVPPTPSGRARVCRPPALLHSRPAAYDELVRQLFPGIRLVGFDPATVN